MWGMGSWGERVLWGLGFGLVFRSGLDSILG